MMMSFLRSRLSIVVRGSFTMAAFRWVPSRNLIGACSREAHVPSATSSMKATIRSWSSMVPDQKEEEKQIDGSEIIAKANGMGEAAQERDQVYFPKSSRNPYVRAMQEDFSKYAKFYDKEFLKRNWEEGRVRDVFQEWKEAHEKVYANVEEEEMRFRTFESTFKYAVETNLKNSVLMALHIFADRTDEEMKQRSRGFEVCPEKIKRNLEMNFEKKTVEELFPLTVMMALDCLGQFYDYPDFDTEDDSDDE